MSVNHLPSPPPVIRTHSHLYLLLVHLLLHLLLLCLLQLLACRVLLAVALPELTRPLPSCLLCLLQEALGVITAEVRGAACLEGVVCNACPPLHALQRMQGLWHSPARCMRCNACNGRARISHQGV